MTWGKTEQAIASRKLTEKGRIEQNNEILDKAKSVPCADCDGSFPIVCMDFDHKKGKKFNLARARGKAISQKKLLAEIAKCDVVCANCHRIRTHKARLISFAKAFSQL